MSQTGQTKRMSSSWTNKLAEKYDRFLITQYYYRLCACQIYVFLKQTKIAQFHFICIVRILEVQLLCIQH